MVFNSAVFLFVFFPAVFLLYRLVPGSRGKNALLVAASLVFYAFGRPAYLALLLGSALVNWAAGLLLRRESGPRRLCCALGVALNLAALGVFKYLDFFTGTLNALFGCAIPAANIPLPLGVSFFTFQAVSYLVDVYRDPAQGAADFGTLLLYLSFFPKLLAGPIVRFGDAAPQIAARQTAPEDTAAGLRRFARGLAKKVLIADAVGAAADAVFALAPEALDARLAWLGAAAYTLQLYFDFSGYSDMAIGLGRTFGFRFPENFNYPYVSLTLTEFWRRWHITLSRWFRDYVYIPLGGNRRGKGRTALNKLIVFLLTGLWHGAGWTFVLWGAWHGLFLMLESAAKPFFARLEGSRAGRAALRLYTLLTVTLGFVIFRAASAGGAWGVISHLVAFSPAPAVRDAATLLLQTTLDGRHVLALALAVLFSAPVLPRLTARLPERGAAAMKNAAALALFALSLLAVAGSGFTPFIYAQF